MQKMKSIIIYGAIILLCVAAFGGYVLSKIGNGAEADPTVAGRTEITGAKTTGTGNQADSPESQTGSVGDQTGSTGNLTDNTGDQADKTAGSDALPANEQAARLIPVDTDITGRSDEEKQEHIREVMKKAVGALDPNPVVGIGRGEDFAGVTAEAVNNAGGLKDIIKKGDVVLIKPNLCVQTENIGSPMITDYRVVQEVINMAYQCGASRVIVAEGNFASNAFLNKGNGFADLKGAELYNFNDCDRKDCYELKPEKSLVGRTLFIPKVYMDADVVINVAKLKTHFITGVSLGLKNNIGVPSYMIYGGAGDKSGLHGMQIEDVIVDLNKIRKPDFTIIDGIVGGEGYGPTLNDPVKSDIVIAGRDIVAVDTIGFTFMGYTKEEVPHVTLAAQEKLGIDDISKIKVVGADLNSIKMKFKRPFG